MSNFAGHPTYKKPTTPSEFIQCLICPGWHPVVVFDSGSRYCSNLKPELIRESIVALRKHPDLSRYTHALTRIIRISSSDEELKHEWQQNLRHLRALTYTSAWGTDQQREKLIEISQNKQVVKAMRYALRKENKIKKESIEGNWIAVLIADGSKASIKEANRFIRLLDPETQEWLKGYAQKTSIT